MTAPERLAADRNGVASAARLVARAGLVEAFGHVSGRVDDGFLISSTRPLIAARVETVIEADGDGAVADGTADVPIETPMHAAIYRSRGDVGAICRTHSPAAVVAGATGEVPPVAHGLGGLSGEVRCCSYSDLVSDPEAADRVASDLGGASCLLLRGNGSVVVGKDLADAIVRAWYLEERCQVSSQVPEERAFSQEELELRSKWFDRESERAWAWLRQEYGMESAD